MDPEIRNFAEIERLIKEHPEVLSFDTSEEFYAWAAKENVDPKIWGVLEAYFDLRDQHEDKQMQEQGEINPSVIPTELIALPILALAFRDRPKIMEDDKNYQKIVEQHKKSWLEKNPGKDFNSKEGLDYLHGSLDNNNAPTLKKDAEQAFRNNPKFKKRVERYDKEKKKVYKNLNEDPAVINTRYEIENHTRSRHAYLKTHEDKKTPEETSALIQKRSWEKFATENPEKTKIYAQTNADIKKAHEKQEIKKQLAETERKTGRQVRYVEEIHRPIPSQPRPIPPERRTTVPQAAGRRFGPPGRRAAPGLGRLGTRLVTQAGLAAGRAAVGALVSNPIGWVVIGVIVVIIIIVFLIIMLAGGGGMGLGGSPPTFECVDADGKSILVTDGNACAQNYAAFYTKQTGALPPITAKCLDKCTDSISIVCDRNPATNRCDPPPLSCGAPEHFCFDYSVAAPRDANNHSTWRHDCSNLDGFDYGGLLGFTVDSCSMAPSAPTPTP